MVSINSMHLHVGHTGIKYKRNDLLMLYFDHDVDVAGVYTMSSITSPTIGWCRDITTKGKARALIVNSGNANTMTGEHGVMAIEQVASSYAKLLNCTKDKILVNSTGVIGEPLPYDKIINAMPTAMAKPASIDDAAAAIMTTDLAAKIAKQTALIEGANINLLAIAKGSGMCAPNMATVLCYVVTDAKIPADILSQLLKASINKSLNCVSVDTDRSTNDSTIMFATGTGQKHKTVTSANDAILADFKHKLDLVLIDIAKKLAMDGEGATKLIQVNVVNSKNQDDAVKIARSVAESPLVKTAFFGNDPNWGRIAMAIGKTNLPVDLAKLKISIGDYDVYSNNKNQMTKEVEANLVQYLKNKETHINIDLGFENCSEHKASFYSCDLTNDYIRINTEYRT